MTVNTINSIAEFDTNGVTTNFPFFFKFLANEDLVVTYIDPLGTTIPLALGTQYTVNGAGTDSGGSIVTTTALAGPGQLVVSREMEPFQQTSLRNQGKFLAETHEDVFDRLTMLIQQSFATDSRALKRPFGKSNFYAENRRITDLANPVDTQDATTRIWVENHFADLIDQVSGVINTTTGIIYDAGTLFDHLRFGVNRTVDSIAALRLLSAARNQRAFVLGYYAKGDGGGGAYFIDPTDTTTADNGGTVIVAADGSRWKLAYTGRVSIDQFGAKRNNLGTDAPFNDAAIQNAFDSGIPLMAGDGTYQLSLSRTITLEAGATVCSLFMRSGLNIHGMGMGHTKFKIRDNESTDASPKFFNMIAGNQVYDYGHIEGISFDLNGQNNKISPNRGTGVYRPYNCAALMISGSVATGGFDARLNNFKFLNNEVINSPGVTCIALGQRYGHPGISGYNIEIAGNRFYNNGIDAGDHSSIFCYANGVNVHHNDFDHPTPSTGTQGPVVAFELHGSSMNACDNTVRNYCQVAWISEGEDGVRDKIIVCRNKGTVNFFGIALFGLAGENDGLSDVIIDDNVIVITSNPINNPTISTLHRAGLYLGVAVGFVLRISARGNKLYCTDRTKNAGIILTTSAGVVIQDAFIEGNTISGFSRGIWAGAGGTGQLANLMLANNLIANCAITTELPAATFGIEVGGANFSVHVVGNKVGSGDTGSPPATGIRLIGTADNLHMEGNNLTTSASGITSTIVVSGFRTGRQALTFSALPAQSTWAAGNIAYIASPPVLGTTPNKYAVEGWLRLTNGTGNVLNTDWVERRTLTGT